MRTLVLLAYFVAGAIVASQHHYFSHAHTLWQIGSAVAAVVLWPLLLIGANLHLHA
jgi:hypothetical protein